MSLVQLTDEVASRIRRRTELNLKLEHIQHEIRELNARRNRFAPISRLPVEVLATVFVAYVAEHWGEYTSFAYHDEQTKLPYQWFAILHVNQDWRRTAFSTQRLWATIVPTRPECVKFMLEHAGCLPLEIRLGCPPKAHLASQADEAHQEVLSELGRMRVAQLRITKSLSTQLATLEKEDLGTHELAIEELLVDMAIKVDSLPLLSTAKMPQLVRLEIRQGSAALVTSFRFPTLTTLAYTTPMMSLAVLKSTLSHFPLLQHLCLDLSFPFYFGFTESDRPLSTVELHHLQTLSIEGDAQQVSLLLSSLTFPQDASVRIVFTHADSELAHGFAVISVATKIAQKRSLNTAPEVATTVFRPRSILLDNNPFYMQLSAESFTQSEDTEGQGCTPIPRLRLSIENPLDEKTTGDLISQLFAFRSVGKIANLESLQLAGMAVTEAFLEALTTPLAPSADLPNDSPTSSCLFPKLTTLDIMSLDLHVHPDHPSEHDFMPRLETMLKRRLDWAPPLEELLFIDCTHVNDKDLETVDNLLLKSEDCSDEDCSCCSHREQSDATAGSDT
ncbi:hypothetical protein NM688_g5822 [Phlebia brevispora]|uniref:Uncharacterized protein n=1 Tax=Phlebia brevispora TaxID=194682 RepID=A0ACC1SPC5_9APHY|nr:hypothetical protein NM688_g5822 [Phlebia brevispora]